MGNKFIVDLVDKFIPSYSDEVGRYEWKPGIILTAAKATQYVMFFICPLV